MACRALYATAHIVSHGSLGVPLEVGLSASSLEQNLRRRLGGNWKTVDVVSR